MRGKKRTNKAVANKPKIPINKNAYSDSSKRSVGHEFLGEFYEDIHYQCYKCKQPAVFTAIQQKKSFEIRKEYIDKRRVLCRNCWLELRRLKSEIQEIEYLYSLDKEKMKSDKEFLERWLFILKEIPKFGKKTNTARIRFIEKILGN